MQIADLAGGEAFPQATAEISLGDLHVVQIPVDLHVRGADLLADADRRRAAVQTVPLVVDPDVHWFEDQQQVVVFGDRRGLAQAVDDVLMHLLGRHAGDVVAGDDGGHLAIEGLGRFAALANGLQEIGVILRFVQARSETPGGELRDFQAEFLSERRCGFDVLVVQRPELDGRETEFGRLTQAVEEGQLAPPHFDVDRELCVRSLAD